jgi:hypothetical protein
MDALMRRCPPGGGRRHPQQERRRRIVPLFFVVMKETVHPSQHGARGPTVPVPMDHVCKAPTTTSATNRCIILRGGERNGSSIATMAHVVRRTVGDFRLCLVDSFLHRPVTTLTIGKEAPAQCPGGSSLPPWQRIQDRWFCPMKKVR